MSNNLENSLVKSHGSDIGGHFVVAILVEQECSTTQHWKSILP